MHFHIVKMYKDKEVNKNVKNIFLSMCDVKLFLTFASLGLVLLWQLFYLFCTSFVINTVIVTAGTFEPYESGRFGGLKSDSTHHFYINSLFLFEFTPGLAGFMMLNLFFVSCLSIIISFLPFRRAIIYVLSGFLRFTALEYLIRFSKRILHKCHPTVNLRYP